MFAGGHVGGAFCQFRGTDVALIPSPEGMRAVIGMLCWDVVFIYPFLVFSLHAACLA